MIKKTQIVSYRLLLFVGLLFSLAITVGIARLGGKPFGHHIKAFVYLFYGFLGMVLLKKYAKKNKLLWYMIFLLPNFFMIFFVFHVNNWKFYQIATPSSLSFILGVVLGLLTSLRYFKYVFLLMLVSGFMGINKGYQMWLHKLNYGNFQPEIDTTIKIKDLQLIDENNKRVYLNSKDDYYILDFWTSSCGYCYLGFDEYRTFYDKIKTLDNVHFFIVNVPFRNEKLEDNLALVKKWPYKVLFYKGTEKILDSIHVYRYPTTLIIKNNEIIGIGNSHSVPGFLKEKMDND